MVDRNGRVGLTSVGPSLGRRLVRAGITLVWTFVICFLLLHAMPGDPADTLDSPEVPAEQAERNRRALGLDQPLHIQFLRTAASYCRGDLGVSVTRRRPVADALASALPHTILLGLSTLLLAYGLGLPLALAIVGLPARYRRRFDVGLLAAAITPRFWLAVVLVLIFHGWAGWLPASHAAPPGGGDWFDRARHLVLPTLALGAPAACVVARFQLAAMETMLEEMHVRAARAVGVGRTRLIAQHVFRPSAALAIALLGLDLPVLVSGAIVIEIIFAWPGVGRLTAGAVLGGDYPLALAATLLTAALVLLGRLVSESLTRWVDPRIEDGAAQVES